MENRTDGVFFAAASITGNVYFEILVRFICPQLPNLLLNVSYKEDAPPHVTALDLCLRGYDKATRPDDLPTLHDVISTVTTNMLDKTRTETENRLDIIRATVCLMLKFTKLYKLSHKYILWVSRLSDANCIS
jgi:hypothetical protein